MSFLKRIFGNSAPDPKFKLNPLYAKIIAKGREVHWYEAGQVPDSLDGRFDMISTILALVILRMEKLEGAAQDSAYLTELFVDDMDAQMREAGIGDVVVAKDMGRIMSVLGGRIGAFRTAFADPEKLHAAINRNIYEGSNASEEAQNHVAAKLTEYWHSLKPLHHDDLIAGSGE
jgi:cytochrome b pre-mRNA-processing protein 3